MTAHSAGDLAYNNQRDLEDRIAKLEKYIEVLHDALKYARNNYSTNKIMADYSITELGNVYHKNWR